MAIAVEPEPSTGGASPPEPPRTERQGIGAGWWAIVTAIAVAALIFALVGVFLPSTSGGTGTGSATGTTVASGPPQMISVELGDLWVKPDVVEVEAGRPVMLMVKNTSTAMDHDLKLNGTNGTGMLKPGESAEVDIGVVSDGNQAWCTVPGHKAAGMVMTFKVKGAEGGSSGAAATGGTAAPAEDTNAKIDATAKPAVDWKPYDPALKPAPGATEHVLQMDATEIEMEVAPGVKQLMWTFNNTVPGPVLRGKVGDIWTITLTNKGTLGHSIDFHASQVAWNDEMRTIPPGESLVYQYKAEYAGIFMYHCGTPPTLHHIGNGMYGALIVDPPNLAPVDHEFVFVQSELYLGPQGGVGDLTKMQNDQWDAVVFNGYYNQYQFAPIRVEPGQKIRVWILDAGPSENSSFHVVGTIFNTVYKEGEYLLQPGPNQGGSQALDLQPAQGGFVEFIPAEKGFYPLVTHKFSNASMGALGLFQAGDVSLDSGASH